MKKILLFIFIFIALSMNLFSQEICLKISKDDFTGLITKETKHTRLDIGSTKVFNFYFYKVDSTFKFHLIYNKNSEKNYFVHKDSEFIFLLFDNSKVIINAVNNFKTDIDDFKSGGRQYIYYSLLAFYNISKVQLEQISNIGIKKVRINYEDTYADEEINETNSVLIKDLINCILSDK